MLLLVVSKKWFKEILVEEVGKAQDKVAGVDLRGALIAPEPPEPLVVNEPVCHHTNYRRSGSNGHQRRATCRDCGHVVWCVYV